MQTYTRTVTTRKGEDMGRIHWNHPDVSEREDLGLLKAATEDPSGFRVLTSGWGNFELVKVCMYDGWPYWKPTPAACFVGPTGHHEWAFFRGSRIVEILDRRAAKAKGGA